MVKIMEVTTEFNSIHIPHIKFNSSWATAEAI